jgi:hypothetical protein
MKRIIVCAIFLIICGQHYAANAAGCQQATTAFIDKLKGYNQYHDALYKTALIQHCGGGQAAMAPTINEMNSLMQGVMQFTLDSECMNQQLAAPLRQKMIQDMGVLGNVFTMGGASALRVEFSKRNKVELCKNAPHAPQ